MKSVPLVVLDTNILVSAQLNPFGAPGRIWDLVTSQQLRLAYDDRILFEYGDVLRREKFGFPQQQIDALFAIFPFQELVCTLPWAKQPLPDPDDVIFLEVAKAANCHLISGNLRHYPESIRDGVIVMSPEEWLRHAIV